MFDSLVNCLALSSCLFLLDFAEKVIPQSKDMHIRLTEDSKLYESVCVCKWFFDFRCWSCIGDLSEV